MARFQQPFQCLEPVKRQTSGLSDLLVASAGPYIYSYVVADGQRLDRWPQNVDSSSGPASGTAPTSESEAPPEKRRKLSSETQDQNVTSAKAPTWSNISIVVTSSDGKYVVVMTSEDKSVRVLELSNEGKFTELSSRAMPKRPCALALTPNGQTILCADKFGDVYALPLIPGEYVKPRVEAKPFQPAATPLTVHTKRNLETLEQQKRAAETMKTDDNNSLNFEHQLILGHVSTLMDMISVSLSGRNYILTADRDEHIRVSRGVPQAHVTERFCLGHTSMISRLCVPSWASNVLVSGGGDGHLFLWNWVEGQPLQQVSLPESLSTAEPTVRGIWDVSLESVKAVLVSLEGATQLLCYTIEDDNLKFQGTIQCSGNVLDVAGIDSRGSLVVSVDAVREPGSTNTWNSTPGALLEAFQITHGPSGLAFNSTEDPLVTNINSNGSSELSTAIDAKKKKELDDSLYNLGNLRKRTFD
ncbi:tRNA (guanine-N(7)-)-methyltransferase non-catalytic subunit trm82 [Penicillium hispanicum]|uniref:tRNA (guanine-N(7)-)-methyltransferase non-catalytic subunit trm82 n=1 Tax=Penicillium hispanicum TaxID=1080232 RepID=UPI002541189A|nr:tRNA (guanine-N(7)-)-methyltransferase non-catalytic subunit trm82 [Penicillium hispanicum]KAJ5586761.1 tRNA (guanine-N(7)-)-methyltransferase non-catalytic subunit trm82 [Penicillium hispanicum]